MLVLVVNQFCHKLGTERQHLGFYLNNHYKFARSSAEESSNLLTGGYLSSGP